MNDPAATLRKIRVVADALLKYETQDNPADREARAEAVWMLQDLLSEQAE